MRYYYLVSDPNKWLASGLSFNESWLKTLRKHLGPRDFNAELNASDEVFRLIAKVSEPPPETYNRGKGFQLDIETE